MVAMPREDSLRPSDPMIATQDRARRTPWAKRASLIALGIAALAAAAYYGYDYWEVGRFMVSTDDAYVQADYTTIAPKVSGYISEVAVADNQSVKAGQLLARIDDRDYRTTLDQARADVAAAQAAVNNYDAQISLQQAEITEAQATIATTQAALDFARSDAERYRDLMKTGAGTIQKAQETRARQEQLTAQLQRDQASLIAAQRKIEVLQTGKTQAAARLAHTQAVAHQAELNLGYTTITAPVDGTVGARSLRVGQYVIAGTQLMAVVPLQAAYIVANYKETQLAHVRPGQPVTISVDGLPDQTLLGHVDSISPGSGLEFALLPPDNATGNFTKIVQRIPVRISFDDPAVTKLLHAGMSVEPSIDTRRGIKGN
ncbi:MAG TPA: HlyD family secretion protein [Rhodopila sp.]|uniref:HlyD family secretion protein n=1 Tax=Rhodopila sp. TaxID=2480087 RepID=UPI002C4A6BF7|nr:HlyD family secretion protein [Rhodopila sp.]HVY15462.1 HlyD family secretion protein [Rhodopila sp.]